MTNGKIQVKSEVWFFSWVILKATPTLGYETMKFNFLGGEGNVHYNACGAKRQKYVNFALGFIPNYC